MRRLEEQTKHSLNLVRLSIVLIIILFVSSLLEHTYYVVKGYANGMARMDICLMAAILPVIVFVAFQYRKIVLNEHYLRTILSHMQEGVIVCDSEEVIEFVNDLADKTFFRRGYKKVRELYENGVYSDEDGTPIPLEHRPVARALRGDVVHNHLVRVALEGENTYVLVNASPLRDNHGNIRGAVETFHDITDYKEIEISSTNKSRAYRLLAENISDLIGIVDIHGTVIFASPSHKTLLGIDHNEYVGHSVLTHVHRDDLALVKEAFARIPIDKKPFHGEFRYLHSDGHSVTVEAKAEPVIDQNGDVSSFVFVARDITAKKLAEEMLQGQNQVLSLIVRGTPLDEVLTEIALQVETHRPGTKCWVVVTKEHHQMCIGPNLPEGYWDVLKPYLQPETVEKYLRESAVFTDISNNPLWESVPHIYNIAVRNNLNSVWTKPLVSPSGEPLGMFGMYYSETNPSPEDIRLYDAYRQLAAIAIHQRISADEIAFLAYHDPLTGLPNQRVLHASFKELHSAATSDTRFAVTLLDIDRFKGINDTFGHGIGNRVVQAIANRLLECVGDGEIVSRLGGDEFALIIRNGKGKRDAVQTANRILQSVQSAIRIDDHEFHVTTSIGIAMYPDHSTDLSELMKFADSAMYDAKAQGRNTLSMYHPDMSNRLFERLVLERDIRHAIENDEFAMYYQPKVDIKTNQITGAEALIRWKHPTKGFVSPAEFIPVAEETGYIISIGQWTLETVLKQLKIWDDGGKPMIPIAVNVSAEQLIRTSFYDFVREALEKYNVNPRWLELEITETAILKNEEMAAKTIRGLSEIGVTMTLDDFGTGYSSLSFLTRFDIRTIKIDRAFVVGLQRKNSADESIVAGLVSLAHNLGMNVVAEGIEMPEQLRFLQKCGCDEAQGYFFSKPIPSHEFETIYLRR